LSGRVKVVSFKTLSCLLESLVASRTVLTSQALSVFVPEVR